MIEANTKFEDNNLIIGFKGKDIDDEQLEISIENDIDFKGLVEFLVKVIPNQSKITLTNEQIPEGDNADKLNIIQDTVNEIIDEFNSSVDELIQEDKDEDVKEEEKLFEAQAENSEEDDDLPF